MSQTLTDSLKNITTFNSKREQAIIYQQIGGEEGYKNLDSALKYSEMAENIALELSDDTILGNVYNDLSISYFIVGDFNKTLEYGDKSLYHRKKTGDSLAIASAYSKLGMGHQELGNLKDATYYYGLASEIFVHNNEKIKAAQIKNNMANILERNDQKGEALIQMREASSILWELKDTARYLVTKANHGDLLRKLGRNKESIQELKKLLPMAHKSFYPDFDGQLYQSIGMAHFRNGDTSIALDYYTKARTIYERTNSKTGLVLMHGNIGTILFDQGKFKEAEREFLAGLPYLKESGSYFHQKLLYEGLYKVNKQKGNATKAFEYSELYHQAKDSIYSETQQKELLSLQKKFETEEKNRKIAEQKSELVKKESEANKKTVIYSISAIMAILLLLFGLLFFRNFKRKKELELKEKELKARQEKLRISRDLHDHIGAELTLIKSRIDQRAFLSKNNEEKKELEEISEYSKTAIDQLRKTIWATKNDTINLDNFVSNLHNYITRYHLTSSIEENHSNTELSSVIALNLFRVCQETINNSVKYSGGKHISISIQEDENKLILSLVDDGKGFNINTVSKGYGLSNMEERMKEINGRFQIESSQSGTKTVLEVIK